MRVYLDNCCYNRPYDDQSQFTVALETECKLYIQELIANREFTLASSYMLEYECAKNPNDMRRATIMDFICENAELYAGIECREEIEGKASEIMHTGIKFKDACHVAAAIYLECDYFISTDKRLLKYQTDEIRMVSPIGFIVELEGR